MNWFRREKTYVILEKGDDGRWLEFTAMVAKTPRQAVDLVRVFGQPLPGTFRAVPARAWGREHVVG